MGTKAPDDPYVIEIQARAAPMGWLDNETIVVFAYLGDKQTRRDGVVEEVGRIASYKYRTGEMRAFGKASSGTCYSDGYASYIFLDKVTDELWASYGFLGSEITKKVKPGEIHFNRGGYYKTCRQITDRKPMPSWAEGKYFVWALRDEHGVFNCGSSNFHEKRVNARMHRWDDPVGVELPFTCYSVRRGFVYYPFKGAYFTQEIGPVIPWPVGRDRKAFWMYPDGKVETLVFPYSTAIRGDMLPTVKGIVAFSSPESLSEEHRIHLITPSGMRELYGGHGGGSVSPDGCKLAMIHDEDYSARLRSSRSTKPNTFKVLDFCWTGK
jgi:hypothetical protein